MYQELRHAKYDGWFVDFVEREAVHEQDWKTLGVVTTSRAKRMKDVQFLSELLVLVLKGDIGGFDQTELDEFYAKYAEPLASDSEVEFEEDYVRDTWSAARKFLVAMEAANGCMAAFGRSFKHLYSIWAVIVLNLGKDADPNAVADKYRNFMAEAEKFKDQAYLDAMMQNEAGAAAMNPLTSLALKYFQNSTGASTEGPQRRARHEALTAALVGAPPP